MVDDRGRCVGIEGIDDEEDLKSSDDRVEMPEVRQVVVQANGFRAEFNVTADGRNGTFTLIEIMTAMREAAGGKARVGSKPTENPSSASEVRQVVFEGNGLQLEFNVTADGGDGTFTLAEAFVAMRGAGGGDLKASAPLPPSR